MVVDDDPEVRTGMRLLLESWGCSVLSADNADDALEMVADGLAFDALVADFRLPGGVSGAKLIENIWKLKPGPLPALLVTGDTEPARLQEASDLNLELLHKPVQPARLRAWLQNSQSD
jgi:CheY-like chemotaxis protein